MWRAASAWRYLGRSLMLLVVCLTAAPPVHASTEQVQVLVLYAHRRDARLAVLGDSQFPALLERRIGRPLDYYAEYLDLARTPERHYQSAVLAFLHEKYREQRFDLIVAMHPVALTFIAANRERLFPDVPVVFFSDVPNTARPANSTGIVSPRNLASSVQFALTLQPDLRNVFVVCGGERRDQEFEAQARDQLRRFEPRLSIEYLVGLPPEQLKVRLASLPPRSMVYYLVVNRDGAGRSRHPIDFLDDIAPSSNAPIYSWVDSAMNHRIVGGVLKSQLKQIEAVAQLSARVLGGERADVIPVSSPDLTVPQVDWRELQRWGLSTSRLPAGTVVLHQELTLWQRYRGYVVAAVLLLAAQTTLIAGLLAQRLRRRAAEQQLRSSEAELRSSYSRIRALGARLLHAQDSERGRIARELHDDVSQQLALLAIDLDTMSSPDAPGRVRALERAAAISKSVHELSHRLYPSKLRLIGLVPALKTLQRELAVTDTSIDLSFDNVPGQLSPDLTLCVFRVIQEALQNAIKHSGARRVAVHLAGGPESLIVSITDDGVGFDVDAAMGQGLGLLSIGERLEALGGTLRIYSAPGAGSRLDMSVPVILVQDEQAEAV